MKVQPINNNTPSFGALNITAEAKTLIEKEKGGKEKLAKYIKELANSRWDLNIEKCSWGADEIMPYFGDRRFCCVIPCYVKDNFVMISSADKYGDNEDDIVDCLKFSSSERAEEVYKTLESHFLSDSPKTPLKHLDWDVYAMKAFTEAELVPQSKSPWAHFLSKEEEPKKVDHLKTFAESKVKKPPFLQRLRAAWNLLLGK